MIPNKTSLNIESLPVRASKVDRDTLVSLRGGDCRDYRSPKTNIYYVTEALDNNNMRRSGVCSRMCRNTGGRRWSGDYSLFRKIGNRRYPRCRCCK